MNMQVGVSAQDCSPERGPPGPRTRCAPAPPTPTGLRVWWVLGWGGRGSQPAHHLPLGVCLPGDSRAPARWGPGLSESFR